MPDREEQDCTTADSRLRARGELSRQMFAFLLTGGLGFVISTALTIAFTRLLDWSPYLAWFPAIGIAIVCTWIMNRVWTFRSRDARRLAELYRYGLVSLMSAAINYAGFAVLLALLGYGGLPVRNAAVIFVASAFGSGVAAIFTFILSRRFAFQRS